LSKAKEDLKKYFSIIAAKVGEVLHGCTGDGAKDAIQISQLTGYDPGILTHCRFLQPGATLICCLLYINSIYFKKANK